MVWWIGGITAGIAALMVMYWLMSRKHLRNEKVMQHEHQNYEGALQPSQHEREAAVRTMAARLGLPK